MAYPVEKIHSKYLLKITVTIQFSFDLTLTVALKTGFYGLLPNGHIPTTVYVIPNDLVHEWVHFWICLV